MAFTLNHLALLVPSVDRSAGFLQTKGFQPGEAQLFDGEGTKEIYIGDTRNERGLLLLMEPTKEGSYRRALNKRGPGVHHIAIDVPNLDDFLRDLAGTGWLALPHTVPDLADTKTIWLSRPGFPALIEAQERDDMTARPQALITSLEIPAFATYTLLIGALRLAELNASPDERFWLTCGSRRLGVHDICRPPA